MKLPFPFRNERRLTDLLTDARTGADRGPVVR